MNTKVIEIIKNLAIKFKDYHYIYNMCRDRKNYIKYENEEIETWGELTLSNGFTALPMIYGELQEHFPEEAWEDIGHEYMKLIVKLIEKNGFYNLSMFSGASGVGLATICVSKNRTRYKKIVNEINNFIQLYFQYYMNMCNEKKYVDSNDYDVIQGLTVTRQII
ncbi:lanthionine synthetase LanC family protein [Clostridium sp. JS66]|uniref:lanthionine synthetase LanC family protein n=1 Tax=Clostridium sp. JS66 TaxID=3064705 RepID=UPI00298E8AD6|nr:lanthionine synthetase LanC family protein [Clostridium sp. JS66]WPC43330.1 lanthionine synthetase LanC family protein [Clostridium sp. JS66]